MGSRYSACGRPPTRAAVFQYQVATMVSGAILNEHRIWGDWVAMGVGVLIGLTPWFLEGYRKIRLSS
jgi:hypothetical protein